MAEARCVYPTRRGRRIGINPDQRIHEDARRLSELSADLGIGLLQASLLLLSFLGVLWSISGALDIWICGISLTIPGYMVWCALLYAASGSWLTWRVGRPLVGMNSQRYQRESEFRFALFQANQKMDDIASVHDEEGEKRRLGQDLEKVLVMVREIVDATTKLTRITAGYGWISIVAPIVIASPAYFSARLSFGELMVVVGGFSQVNQSLRWFVDNFALLADWRATLSRVIKFREMLLDRRPSPAVVPLRAWTSERLSGVECTPSIGVPEMDVSGRTRSVVVWCAPWSASPSPRPPTL